MACEEHNLALESAAKIIQIFDRDGDGKLNYLEFSKAITPKNLNYISHMKKIRKGGSKVDEKEQENEWMEELCHVFNTTIRGESILNTMKMESELDAERLFAAIDQYNLHCLSTNALCKWVSEMCGYRINESEIGFLLSRYDKDGDYRINKQEFLQELSYSHTE